MPRTVKGLRFHPACELINEPVLVAWAPLRTGDSWVRKESHLSLTATTIATLSSSPGPSVPTGQREGGQVTPALTACGTELEWRSAGLRDPDVSGHSEPACPSPPREMPSLSPKGVCHTDVHKNSPAQRFVQHNCRNLRASGQ